MARTVFNPNITMNKVIVVGAGGTGSRLLPKLAQFMANNKMLTNPLIYLVDDDIVEEKNCVRQNFIKLDVGKHKASILASRYSKAYGIPIHPVIGRLGLPQENIPEGVAHFNSPLDFGILGASIDVNENFVVVMCVDKVDARRDIIRGILNSCRGRVVFLDSGNEATYGQVRVFTNHLPTSDINQEGRPEIQELYTSGKPFASTMSIEQFFSEVDIENQKRHYAKAILSKAGMVEGEPMQPFRGNMLTGVLKAIDPMVFPPALPGRQNPQEAGYEEDISLKAWPIPVDHYYHLEDNPGESCADLDQTLAVNDLASSLLMGYLQTIGYKLPLENMVSYFTVNGSNSYTPFSLQEYFKEIRPYGSYNAALHVSTAFCTKGFASSKQVLDALYFVERQSLTDLPKALTFARRSKIFAAAVKVALARYEERGQVILDSIFGRDFSQVTPEEHG